MTRKILKESKILSLFWGQTPKKRLPLAFVEKNEQS